MKERELRQLFQEMTLEEKCMQLVQVRGDTYDTRAALTGNQTAPVSPRVRQLAGATIGIMGPGVEEKHVLREIQERYMAEHPHHIPLFFMADVIHGLHTVFPCPIAQGATFDPALSEEMAEMQADEASGEGLHVTFSPMADLCRDARWGRVMESPGEDKLLNARMAAAMVRGYQGTDLNDEYHVASCFKHFAAYGAAEAGRDYQNTELSEHTLREAYLPAYRAAVDAGARMAMSSFNSWNGIPATGSEFLLRKILREEWGFDGMIISDWDAVGQLVPHGFAEDTREAAQKAIQAGVDMDMCTGAYAEHLTDLVEKGEIDSRLVEEAAWRVLVLKNELGLFENPFRGMQREPRFSDAEKRALARRAVAESLVLLKNEGNLLPLRGEKIALIGPYAESTELLSAWAQMGSKEPVVSLAEGAGGALAERRIMLRTAPGCTMLDQDTMLSAYLAHTENWEAENERLMREALEAARWADTVVLCLGEHHLQTGEAASRTELSLPEVQMNLLRKITAVCPNTVTLIMCGRPLVLKEAAEKSRALAICWFPGTEGGNGIWDVLLGKASPGGCLPMSFPRSVGQEPLHYDQYPTGRPAPETRPAIFTSVYLDCPNSPLYPFGFGLSYGNVSLSPVALSGETLEPGQTLTAEVQMENTGTLPAKHTVQLYIRDLSASRVRPVRELKDFRKITLRPGERTRVSFTIEEPMLRFWRGDGTFGSEPGRFTLWIGMDSTTKNSAEFQLAEHR